MVSHDSLPTDSSKSKNVFALLAGLPGQLLGLLRAEIDQFKAEMAEKAKRFGIGAAILVVALIFLFFAIGVFTAAAVLALALVLPGWAAALIVGGVFLVIAVVLVLIGVRSFSGGPDVPGDAIDRIRTDVDVVRGVDTFESRKRDDA